VASVSRRDVYLKAREYLGTPFHQQGRLKRVGLDCVGIVLCVGAELGLKYKDGRAIGALDHRDYGLYPVLDEMQEKAKLAFIDCGPRAPIAGDILTLAPRGDLPVPRRQAPTHHMAIVSDLGRGELGIIHAYGSLGKVAEHILDSRWRRRIAGVFGYEGLSD
jgi:hypothetical protein